MWFKDKLTQRKDGQKSAAQEKDDALFEALDKNKKKKNYFILIHLNVKKLYKKARAYCSCFSCSFLFFSSCFCLSYSCSHSLIFSTLF